jgi:hypothetical protein
MAGFNAGFNFHGNMPSTDDLFSETNPANSLSAIDGPYRLAPSALPEPQLRLFEDDNLFPTWAQDGPPEFPQPDPGPFPNGLQFANPQVQGANEIAWQYQHQNIPHRGTVPSSIGPAFPAFENSTVSGQFQMLPDWEMFGDVGSPPVPAGPPTQQDGIDTLQGAAALQPMATVSLFFF